MRGSDVSAVRRGDDGDLRTHVAASVSPEAAAILQMVGAALSAMPQQDPPATLADFDAAAAKGEAWAEQMTAAPMAKLAPTLTRWKAGGVPVLTVTPREHTGDSAPLVYVHGGGFVTGSAQSSRLTAALAAATSGRIVHSIDYTLAPRADYRMILDEVVTAWTAIVAQADGRPGLFGDSAGGCIATAATMLLRDRGLPLPGAIALLSPVVDLAGEGDTNRTLAPVDYLERRMLEPALCSYADPAVWKDPLASPIHGDFSAFPPVLVQVGTREMLLSDSVRLHRRLQTAGRSSRLEVFEGMPHVFQPLLAETPEGMAAWADMAAFWRQALA